VSASYLTEGSDLEGFAVEITQAARKGYLQGGMIGDPATSPIQISSDNNTIKLVVDSRVSKEIKLTEKTYTGWQEIVNEIQTQIDNDENIGNYGVKIDYVDLGENGYLRLESGSYGKNSRIEIQAGASDSAFTILGLASAVSYGGQDVAGTINGEEAVGSGQMLVGKEGNAATEGLRLKVTLTDSDLAEGAEAVISLKKGIASQFDAMLDSLTRSQDGMLARRSGAVQKQMDYTAARIKGEEERLEIRKQALYKKFFEMESLLGELSAQGAYLESQLSLLSSNWKLGSSSRQ
jgi:flagellar capping protein FliD